MDVGKMFVLNTHVGGGETPQSERREREGGVTV